jgi:hypothetical protein
LEPAASTTTATATATTTTAATDACGERLGLRFVHLGNSLFNDFPLGVICDSHGLAQLLHAHPLEFSRIKIAATSESATATALTSSAATATAAVALGQGVAG